MIDGEKEVKRGRGHRAQWSACCTVDDDRAVAEMVEVQELEEKSRKEAGECYHARRM